jgi:hypothetical protein
MVFDSWSNNGNYNLEMLIFAEGGKLHGEPGEKPSKQEREPTNSTHMGRRVNPMNPIIEPRP